MNQEYDILKLADYHEHFSVGECEAELIINQKMRDYPCLFGFVHLTESRQDTEQLFSAMEQRAREMGYHTLAGPVNYCSWMSYRWAVSRFDLQLYPDCSNPPFYPKYLQEIGYKPLYTYRSAEIDMENPMYQMGERLYQQKIGEGYTFVTYENEAVYEQADAVFDISCAAFRGSYLYCDIPREVFHEIYLTWTKGLHIALCMAYDQGKPVGYVMGYDNPDGTCFISKTSAVLPEYQMHKIYTALLYLGWKYVIAKGYSKMMYHFQCEQKGTFHRFDENIESDEKRYAVFVKEI
ncbi:MAG: GNAT family N-acetyltransferase [Oscillospiraceae bacterium]|nr:GNAT family N-acetyltransferase [Oscillospiraceae bacterium]